MQTNINQHTTLSTSNSAERAQANNHLKKPWHTPQLTTLKLEQTQKSFSNTEHVTSGPKAGS
ncbi:MAG: hypothetical protein ACOYNY_40710 [Caldilineaceae bacterium]